jgi:peptidoglycan/xylan/chitin deacetylase (PgdA/CDA1 family)
MQGKKLTILMYHRVLERPDPVRPDDIDARTFSAQLRALARFFRVLPLGDAIERLQDGTLPARAVAITFDDGYADNCEQALPILARLGLPATFFVATGFLDGGRMWNDTVIEAVRRWSGRTLAAPDLGVTEMPIASEAQRARAAGRILAQWKYLPADERRNRTEALAERLGASLPTDLMMRSDQVRTLHRHGMEIGGHTVTHPILAQLPDDVARAEIGQGKESLERLVGAPLRLFAYPNGRSRRDFDRRHVAMAREAGYVAAVSTRAAVAHHTDGVFELPRLSPWGCSSARFVAQMLHWRIAGTGVAPPLLVTETRD